MKRQIGSFILAVVAGILLPHAVHAQAKAPSEPEKTFTADQLEGRFNDILAKKLNAANICLSFGAARGLESIVRNAATEVVNSKKADALSLAEKNFQRFATALINEGREGSGEVNLRVANGRPPGSAGVNGRATSSAAVNPPPLVSGSAKTSGGITPPPSDNESATSSGEVRITMQTIAEVLNGEIIRIATDHEREGLCPLFPICK